MLLVPTLQPNSQMIVANDEISMDGVDLQNPHDSFTYYEDTLGSATSIQVEGNYAYVASDDYGLAIIDISDPTNPGTPIYEVTLGTSRDVAIDGNFAFVADWNTGLAIINITDPTNPGTPVYESTSGDARAVCVRGNYAYVADWLAGLAIIDISDPTNPGTPIYENTNGYAADVYVDGNYAYVTCGIGKFAVIDISDPTNPGLPVYEMTSGDAWGVDISGDYAYVGDTGIGLAVIDISTPSNPGTPVYEPTLGTVNALYVEGNYVYAAVGTAGITIIDITDPTNPVTPVYKDTTGYASDIYVDGNYAYVACGTSGLAVIDISDQITPETPVYEDTTGSATDIYVSGDYAYVTDGASGLAITDISDPTNPGSPIYVPTTGFAANLDVSGNYAYVTAGSSGLAVIDISDPTSPGSPVYAATTGNANNVYVSGDYAYVADHDSGLAIIDISDPTTPGTPVYRDTTGYAYGVSVSGNYAFVADGGAGLAVIDISDPTSPSIPHYVDTVGATMVYISGDYAYITEGSSGMAVIDISDPTNPGTPVYENTAGNANDIYVSGDHVYVADRDSGLAIIGVADPTDPDTPTYVSTTGNAQGVYVSGDYAYVGTWDKGLAVIPVRKRVEMADPTISLIPSDFTVETGYSGESISWTATDSNPSTYIVELQGAGVVVTPTVWTSGEVISYDIPDGFGVGIYTYTITFMDIYGSFKTDSMSFTVDDTIDPIFTSTPSDFTVEFGYSGQSISWTATDSNPSSYIVELQGAGVVVTPTDWTSGEVISYDIPNDFTVGDYNYTITFTDDGGNMVTDTIVFKVDDTTPPIITVAPNNFTVEYGYTEQSISWSATDLNPETYTIELEGVGIVVTPTVWTSGETLIYDIPDNFAVGAYLYTIFFMDGGVNVVNDSVIFTVDDTIDPIFTSTPNDFTVESGYSGESISWTATDFNPDTYTIELQEAGIVVTPTVWTSGGVITFTIPDGFEVGVYIYIFTLTDEGSNTVSDSVTFTVEDTTNPTITNTPSDVTTDFGYSGQIISWTATDLNPNTYSIELQGSGIVDGPMVWTSGNEITYTIPDGFSSGTYVYTITFTDESGNLIIDNVVFTVEASTNTDPTEDKPGIPGAKIELTLLITLSTVASIAIMNKKKHWSSLS